MIKAVFIDFYGTVVFEDGEVIKKVTQEIYETGKVENKSEIGGYWWNEFQTPPIFGESKQFFAECRIPIYVVSNIDREDILAAI